MNAQTQQNLTKNQSLVMNALSNAHQPLSAYMILDKLRDDGFRAPLQVYRALENAGRMLLAPPWNRGFCHLRILRAGDGVSRSRNRPPSGALGEAQQVQGRKDHH